MPSWLLTIGLITFSPWKVLSSADYSGCLNPLSVQDRSKEEMGEVLAIKESSCEGNGTTKDIVHPSLIALWSNTETRFASGTTLSPLI